MFIAKLLTQLVLCTPLLLHAMVPSPTETRELTMNAPADPPQTTTLRFEVSTAEGLLRERRDGRLFVLLGRRARPEPRSLVGDTSRDAAPILARDVSQFGPDAPGIIDARAVTYPMATLAEVPAGDYFAQAVFDFHDDLRAIDAPGNLYGDPIRVHVDPALGGTIKLELTRQVATENLPRDTEQVKFLKVESKRLSAFHGRPIFLRAAVILPRDHAAEADRRYPLRVHIGGYGERFTSALHMMAPGSPFRRVWNADDTPRMILLHLDGDGPLGDPYQINSANHGPYGDALVQDLIPLVESRFRGIGKPHARVLDGGSTGGWVSLALQVFYPDEFNGAWSFCPDAVDFRAFQLINIYEDENAYTNADGTERAACRDRAGNTDYTMRHECRLENVLGRGDSWTMSGGQWGAWNATYGPRSPDGRPVALWDPRTGKIDRSVVEHWKQYDLRMILERDWPTLGPKLQGKIHIWVGEADNYFLNHAVHRLDAFLSRADPPYGGSIQYGPGQGHCWMGISERAMMDQMAAAMAH